MNIDPTPRLPASFAGSISEGTLNARHLVPRYVEVLAYCWPTHDLVAEYGVLSASLDLLGQFLQDEPRDVADLLGFWECERMGYLLEGLFDALNVVAPEGTYFGASEGDGASFGFWDMPEDEDDFAKLSNEGAQRFLDAMLHPTVDDCPDEECTTCGERDCPDGEPLHYHHDGCPACDAPTKG